MMTLFTSLANSYSRLFTVKCWLGKLKQKRSHESLPTVSELSKNLKDCKSF